MAHRWQKRDRNIMFAVNYEDGRTAYITIDPTASDQAITWLALSRASVRTKARSP
jgi:hypothetical protein